MRLVIETFTHFAYLAVIIIDGFSFIRNGIFTICKSKFQRTMQSTYFVAILFLIFHELKLLQIVYRKTVFELEGTLIGSKLKSLQYIGENVLSSVIVFSLALILESFKNFKIKEMKDRKVLKFSSMIYGCLRLLLFGYLITSVFKDIALYSFLIELLMISEFFVLMLTFISLRETIKKLQKEVEVCLMNDKSYVQHILSKLKSFSIQFVFATASQCIYRIIYLTVIFNRKTKMLLIMKDVSSFLKIISIHLILENINNLIVFNDPSASARCGEDENDKFFVFEEDHKAQVPI